MQRHSVTSFEANGPSGGGLRGNSPGIAASLLGGGGGGYPTPRESSAGVLTLRSSGPAQPLPPHLQQGRRTHGISPEALHRQVSRYLRTVE